MTREDFLNYAAGVYRGTRSVFRAIPADKLGYRPRPDMMSLGQVIRHCASAAASPLKHTLENTFPPSSGELKLPRVEDYKSYDTVQEALDHLDRDERMLREIVMGLSEEEFQTRPLQAPWSPVPFPFWQFALMMVDHLSGHRMQAFQYLHILGLPVNTGTLFGM